MPLSLPTRWPFLLPALALTFSACKDEKLESVPGGGDSNPDLTDDTGTVPTDDTGTAPTDDTGTHTGTPDQYTFQSQYTSESSVAYDGQTFRHLLIEDLKSQIDGLTGRIDGGWYPTEGEITAELDFYFRFDSDTSSGVEHNKATDPAPLQATYGEVSSGKDLVGKIAGNDAEGQHEDWSADFVGWDDPAVTTPESLVTLWFNQLDEAAVARSLGEIPLGPDGVPVSAVHLTADGRNLKELLQKFLLGAVTFSQGADDYLDDDLEGKGLNASNAAAEDGKPYTALEHAWDEGFGYFGAGRDYGSLTDEHIADTPYADTLPADGMIDLLTEVTWGHAINASKRDLGAVVATDLSADGWNAFVEGRALITNAGGDLDTTEKETLRSLRDQAIFAWEAAIAATVVHYINDTLRDMGTFATADYNFDDHAKHWSELKGFALSFQFNPRSPISDTDFVALHDLLGIAPVLPTATTTEITTYRANLVAARDMVGAAFNFDPANLGDADGNNGW